jgi:hypothetical protein
MIGYSRKLMILALANAQGYDVKRLTPEQFSAMQNLWCDDEPMKKEKKTFLEELDEMEPVARVLRVSRAKYLELQDINPKSEIFDSKRENWWLHLRNAMRKFKIDKNTLAQYGIDWAECRKFYFAAV